MTNQDYTVISCLAVQIIFCTVFYYDINRITRLCGPYFTEENTLRKHEDFVWSTAISYTLSCVTNFRSFSGLPIDNVHKLPNFEKKNDIYYTYGGDYAQPNKEVCNPSRHTVQNSWSTFIYRQLKLPIAFFAINAYVYTYTHTIMQFHSIAFQQRYSS